MPWSSRQIFRLAVLGGDRVGKSALTIQFVLGYFADDCGPNIDESYRKLCQIDGGGIILLEVLDPISDQEFYTTLTEQDIRESVGFLLVYSITSRRSFEEVVTAYQLILRSKRKGRFSVILVANKCDLESEREVGIQEGQDLAMHFGCTFIETSAKKCIRVDEAFMNLAHDIHKRELADLLTYNKPRDSDDRSRGCRGSCVIV